MADENLLQSQHDNAKLLTKMSIITLIVYSIITGFIIYSGLAPNWVKIDVYSLAIIPYLITLLYSLASLIYGSVSTASLNEELEKAILQRTKKMSAFDTSEDVRYTAKRRFLNYTKYSPYVFAILAAITISLALFLFYRAWDLRIEPLTVIKPLQKAFLCSVLMIINICWGAFNIGQSREREFRWLRPVGAWLVMGFVNMGIAALGALFISYEKPGFELYTRNVLCVIYIILAAEVLISFITEFYRPRTKGVQKPVFESRLLGLFTEPGGVMRNIADTLDYQFGFKVSKTWIYQFLETAIAKLVIVWMLILWLTTMIAEVGPDEVGVRETFGKRSDNILESGLYLTAPWPFGKISRFAVYKVHEIVVGPEMKKKDGKIVRPPVVLWTKSHYAKEARFVVAAEKRATSTTEEVPVGFLSASFPVQYRIKNTKEDIINYAYAHKDPSSFLKSIAEKVISKYLASADLLKIMSIDRQKTIHLLQEEIQEQVNKNKLGIEIVCVNFHDSHPPVEKVAPVYQEVIGAMEQKETEILNAKADSVRIAQQAEADSRRLILTAEAAKSAAIELAKAEKERFQKQYAAYKEMPKMFMLRSVLNVLEEDAADVRKYILSDKFDSEVYQINLEEKTRYDLLDADLTNFTK